MQHITRVLHSTHIFLFSRQRSFGFGIANRGKRNSFPSCFPVLMWTMPHSISMIYCRIFVCHPPPPCFCTIKYSCKPRYSVLINQRAFQTDFAIYRPKTALKSVSSCFGETRPICGSFKGNKHT